MNFGDRNVNRDGFLAGRDFLLVAAMTKLAFDLDISAFGQFRGRVGQLAPEHNTVPLGTALIAAVLFLPAALGRKREVGDGDAVGGLMSFWIGADEADEVEGAAPKPKAELFWKGAQTRFGKRSPNPSGCAARVRA